METADKCLSLWAMIFACKCRGREWEGKAGLVCHRPNIELHRRPKNMWEVSNICEGEDQCIYDNCVLTMFVPLPLYPYPYRGGGSTIGGAGHAARICRVWVAEESDSFSLEVRKYFVRNGKCLLEVFLVILFLSYW